MHGHHTKRLNLTLTVLVTIASICIAETTRGLKVQVLKDEAGETIGLFTESHALLIGVSDYTAGWPDLESVPREIDEVAEALEAQGFDVRKVLNPDEVTLRDAFQNFIDDYGYDAGNRLLFLFSGHGYSRKDGTAGYLVPADAPNPKKNMKGFLQKALTMDQVKTWCKNMEARHVIFLFDSCFSGTIFKTRALPSLPKHITSYTARPVRQFITAGSAGEEVPAKSYFIPSLLRGLRGESDLNGDHYVTGTELGMYLHDELAGYDIGQTPQHGKIQDPDLNEGDFVFFVPTGEETVVIAQPEPPVTVKPVQPAVPEKPIDISSEADSNRELYRTFALSPEKPLYQSKIKALISSTTDQTERQRLTVAYILSCLLSKNTTEAERATQFMQRSYPDSLFLTYLSLETIGEKCQTCGGSGEASSPCDDCHSSGKCSLCRGAGRRSVSNVTGGSRVVPCTRCKSRGACPICSGSGQKKDTCSMCHGEKLCMSTHKVRSKIAQLFSDVLGQDQQAATAASSTEITISGPTGSYVVSPSELAPSADNNATELMRQKAREALYNRGTLFRKGSARDGSAYFLIRFPDNIEYRVTDVSEQRIGSKKFYSVYLQYADTNKELGYEFANRLQEETKVSWWSVSRLITEGNDPHVLKLKKGDIVKSSGWIKYFTVSKSGDSYYLNNSSGPSVYTDQQHIIEINNLASR